MAFFQKFVAIRSRTSDNPTSSQSRSFVNSTPPTSFTTTTISSGETANHNDGEEEIIDGVEEDDLVGGQDEIPGDDLSP